jgi:hypothetical protein
LKGGNIDKNVRDNLKIGEKIEPFNWSK